MFRFIEHSNNVAYFLHCFQSETIQFRDCVDFADIRPNLVPSCRAGGTSPTTRSSITKDHGVPMTRIRIILGATTTITSTPMTAANRLGRIGIKKILKQKN